MANVTRYPYPNRMMPLSEAVNQLMNDAFTWPTFSGQIAGGSFNSALYDTRDGYKFMMALPGVASDAVEINIEGNTLTVQGKFSESEIPAQAHVLWSSMPTGEFHQQITLPSDVKADDAVAQFEHGILMLTLPKPVEARIRTIKVQEPAHDGKQLNMSPTIEGETTH